MSGERAARVGYADLLRCLSAVAVVALHASGAFLADLPVSDPGWYNALWVSSLTRWSVPMFVMLSGMFLLDPDRSFDWKRWRRRIAGLALVTAAAAYLYALWDSRGAHPGLEHLLEALILFVRGELHYHLWFLPMLLSLYLLTPALRAFVAGADRKTLWYAMGLWGVFSLALPFVYGLFPSGAGLLWLERLEVYNVLGYTGYFLLGYLLKTCAPRPWQDALLYGLGALGWMVTALGTLFLSRSSGALDTRFFSNFSPFVALTAAALFLLFRFLDCGRRPVWAKLARLTPWVYLLHPLVLELFF